MYILETHEICLSDQLANAVVVDALAGRRWRHGEARSVLRLQGQGGEGETL